MPAISRPLAVRFAEKLGPPLASGCREWQGAVNAGGYGQIKDEDGKQVGAHRIAWKLFRGPVPVGLVVMHSCDNRLCAEIGHLSLGSPRENSIDMARKRRGREQRKTHCPAGHTYDEKNTRIHRDHGGTRRSCRACERVRDAARRPRARRK